MREGSMIREKGYFYQNLGREGEKREEERGGGFVDDAKEKKDLDYIIYHSLEYGREEFKVERSYICIGEEQLKYTIVDFIQRTFHNTDGPAVFYSNDAEGYYYLDGVLYSSEEAWRVNLDKIKNMPLAMRLTDPREWIREFKDE